MAKLLKQLFSHPIVLLLGLTLLFQACVPGGTANGRKTSASLDNSNDLDDDTPNPGEPNFWQSGGIQYAGTLNIGSDFDDSFYLRGTEVHEYLKIESNRENRECLVLYFGASPSNKLLVLSASAESFTNFSTGEIEYYYLIHSTDKAVNQSHCQTAALTSILATEYPGSTIAYVVNELCTTCTQNLLSNAGEIFKSSAIQNTNVDLSLLRIQVNGTQGNGGNQNPTCTSSSQCQGLGYDCCLNGQCVNDKALINGIDPLDPIVIQILQLVASDPSRYYDYPEYFYLCPVQVDPTATPTEPDPVATAQALQKELAELKACTNTDEDNERSICTTTIENATSQVGIPLPVALDDRNFSNTFSGFTSPYTLDTNSIVKIEYAGEVLFENGTTNAGTNYTFSLSVGNDDFLNAAEVTINEVPIENAPNSSLRLSYQIDGSCERISNSLARCKKYYLQGQASSVVGEGQLDDHKTTGTSDPDEFLLPFYSDTSRLVKVEVDSIPYYEGTDWNLVVGATKYIEFITSGIVANGSTVTLTFFVDLGSYPVLTSKEAAYERINNFCGCASDDTCTLKEDYDEAGNIIGYLCVFPTPDVPEPPQTSTVYINASAAPVKFFDSSGDLVDKIILGDIQEGTAFSYASGNTLNPNNQGTYIGFNEIYGNLSVLPGTADAPTMVSVKYNKTYDIYVDNGSWGSCDGCGYDAYSFTAKLFPDSLNIKGGGYFPDSSRTNRFQTTGFETENFRADDLLFGRACFLPVTMIPWAHSADSNITDQRSNRQQAQHFLFANGYNKDWYGFDYGSVIGSFDGITWFSIGSQRQIKATSTKLYLAINAYFSDQADQSSFQITVQENFSGGASVDDITSDFDSDGAECQQFHLCQTDQDCAAQLGWDYACEPVGGIVTNWPKFDLNGNEVANQSLNQPLISILKGFSGPSLRCVYRGKGSLCHPDYTLANSSNSYAGSDEVGLNSCTANHYCQNISGLNSDKFNTQIARFAKSPGDQNDSSLVTLADEDELGLAARVIGRSQEYQGSEQTPSQVANNLSDNNAIALCLPGRDIDITANFQTQHSEEPESEEKGDRVGNIGMTESGDTALPSYFSSCPTFDDSENYLQFLASTDLTTNAIFRSSATQNISTNSLAIFENINGVDLLQPFGTSVVTQFGFQADRCLRAPGASCFTDLDCAPNKKISDEITSLTATLTGLQAQEVNYWKEHLVCGQKNPGGSINFDLKDNKCCRPIGEELTIGTNINSDPTDLVTTANNSLLTNYVPGLDDGTAVDINDPKRYSRFTPVYKDMRESAATYPDLRVPASDSCTTETLAAINPGGPVSTWIVPAATPSCTYDDTNYMTGQWKTFSETAARTCCGQTWVREFHEDNGNDQKWTPDKMQNIDKSNFKCLNWDHDDDGLNVFECSASNGVLDPGCEMRSISLPEAFRYLNFFGSLELVGIPQVMIQSDDFGFVVEGTDIICNVDPVTGFDYEEFTTDGGINKPNSPIPGSIKSVFSDGRNNSNIGNQTAEYITSTSQEGTRYFSAADTDNFDSDIKQVFDSEKVRCCYPTGEAVPPGTAENQCCSSQLGVTQEGALACCLPSGANISVYLNRYVSNEADTLNDSQFDSRTGFIKDTSTVLQIAQAKNLCCSGSFQLGAAYSTLGVPGVDSNEVFQRFVSGDRDSDNLNGEVDFYNNGFRWNTHVYCQ